MPHGFSLFKHRKDGTGGEQTESSARLSFVTGINVVHEPKDPSEAVVDIVFLHGITGDREGTWTAGGATAPWPGQFLPKALPRARIILFGYDARVVAINQMVSQGTISSHAKSLLNTLANKRDETDTKTRAIIFVVHSMGGLVCEDALLLSKDTPETHLKSILSSTKGIAFLGTPHAGARALAEWAGGLASCINMVRTVNKELLATLETDSQVLARIQEGFHTMMRARQLDGQPGIHMTCFFEQIKLPVIGYVVHPQSAILPAYTSIPMNKTHITMTRFLVEQDPDYLFLLGELRRWYQALIPTQAVLPTQVKEPMRNPQNDKEFLAFQHAEELKLTYDKTLDHFIIPMPRRLLPFDDIHKYQFPNPQDIDEMQSPSHWQRLIRMFHYGEGATEADQRLRLTPLPLVPVRHEAFLALVRTSDIFRILASSVSERQKGDLVVLVHNTKYLVTEPYQELPVVKPMYANDNGHWIRWTVVQSRQWGDAFSGTGSLPPDVSYNINFVCSKPGYETIQMPALLALYEMPPQCNVLFAAQYNTCYSLWQSFVVLLDEAWDHDNAFECTSEEVPLKKYVDSYRSFVVDQRLAHKDEWLDKKHKLKCNTLMSACARYFSDPAHADLSFEKEDLVRCINAVVTWRQELYNAQTPDLAGAPRTSMANVPDLDKPKLIDEWYARWDFEGTRWLLIALTITLGQNFCSVQALPESFDCLLESPNCYIA